MSNKKLEIIDGLKKLKNTKFLGACNYCNGRDYTLVTVPAAVQTPLPQEYTTIKIFNLAEPR